tara:strand:- start:75 stop:482 length:408 start_codon:yes stop_codon:yes gene_type:complete
MRVSKAGLQQHHSLQLIPLHHDRLMAASCCGDRCRATSTLMETLASLSASTMGLQDNGRRMQQLMLLSAAQAPRVRVCNQSPTVGLQQDRSIESKRALLLCVAASDLSLDSHSCRSLHVVLGCRRLLRHALRVYV